MTAAAPLARPRRATTAAAAALVGAASLPGCGAIISYGIDPGNPLEPLGGMKNDGIALAGLADTGPISFLFFSPIVIADAVASLAIDLALMPFVLLDHISGEDRPEPYYPPCSPSPPPPPEPAPPTPPDAPAEWPLLVGVPPAVEGAPAADQLLTGPELEALVASVGAGDRGRLRLLSARGRQVEPGATTIAAAAPLPDGRLAFAHRATVELFDPATPVEAPARVDDTRQEPDRIVGLAARDDGACLAFASAQGAWLCVLGPDRPGWGPTPLPNAPRGGRALALHGRLVAVGGWDGDVAVYALGQDEESPQPTLVARAFVAVPWSHGGTPAATPESPGDVWPTAAAWISSLAWQGGELVIGRGDGQLLRWAPLGDLPPAPAGPSLGAAPLVLQAHERGLVVGLADGRVLLVHGGEEALLGRHAGPVVALHARGGLVASAGLDGVVRILDLETPAAEALDAVDLGPLEDLPCGVALDEEALVVATRRGLLLRYEAR